MWRVAVADGRAVQDHGVVEQGAGAFGNRLQLAEQIGELGQMEAIDPGDLGLLFLVAGVVRQVVVPFGDVDGSIAAVAAFVGQGKRGDAGLIGLKGQHHHVQEQTDVLLEVVRHAARRGCWPRSGYPIPRRA